MAIIHQFLANRTEIFYGNWGDYYLSIGYEKSCFGPYLPFSIFWAMLGPKKGRGPTDTHMVWDLKTQPKSWLTWCTFSDLGPPS